MLKRKNFMLILLILMMIFTITACTNKSNKSERKNDVQQSKEVKGETKYPLTIKDSYEREVIIEKEPQKIISIAPNITETIFDLGKKDKLIGRTEYCDYPKEVEKIEVIGSLKTPNIEKITELKPDLIIASTHFNKKTLKKLEDLGMKVVVLYGEETFDGAYETIEKVGTVLNAQDKAAEIVSSMKKKVEDIKKKVEVENKPSVYYVVTYGKGGDYTAGKGTFIGQMIEMAGGKNAADDVEGWKYSIERLIEKNPNMLVCSSRFDTKKGIENTNGYKDLDAVKNDKLYEIDENLITRQGPRLTDGLEELAKIIHPEAFK
ncbi:ABC transporter substrate-binding protein [Clostridium ganghwense]|uniref:ABC transporter substrate-binding protein n=1 Tax=Clostridium ganghwense TaxID=312089 RepID=A0ABT4CKS2_9CLOT|nr:ABC transporter substrate-binding protein [Clostridium ganghwense]MCY6369645.1 ABC transporter substrate-binding protein [Clostridium ganghwense]